MERVLIVLAFIFSLNAYAAAPAGVPQFSAGYDPAASVASKTFAGSDLSKLITLTSGSDGPTANNLYRMVKMGAQGTSLENYQVTSGKVLYCSGFFYETDGTWGIGFGYGTAAVTNDNASAPAGDKYQSNSTGASVRLGTTSAALKWAPLPMAFPASSFPYMKITTNTTIGHAIVICEEQ